MRSVRVHHAWQTILRLTALLALGGTDARTVPPSAPHALSGAVSAAIAPPVSPHSPRATRTSAEAKRLRLARALEWAIQALRVLDAVLQAIRVLLR
jgi:hypothetical protein